MDACDVMTCAEMHIHMSRYVPYLGMRWHSGIGARAAVSALVCDLGACLGLFGGDVMAVQLAA